MELLERLDMVGDERTERFAGSAALVADPQWCFHLSLRFCSLAPHMNVVHREGVAVSIEDVPAALSPSGKSPSRHSKGPGRKLFDDRSGPAVVHTHGTFRDRRPP